MSGYILGLTGWRERSHDASACIVKDGEILAMVEEERFVRKKRAYDKVPIHSIKWCLSHVGITINDIETVAVGWDYKRLYELSGEKSDDLNNLTETFFPSKYFSLNKKPNIKLVSHHLAHAASSYFLSGMDRATILIVDGQGEDASTTIAKGENGEITMLRSFGIEHSLGYFYEAVSDFLGLGLESAGKTMGLASYGNVIYDFDEIQLLDDGYRVNLTFDKRSNSLDQQARVVKAWGKRLSKAFGKKNYVDMKFDPIRGSFNKSTKIETLQRDIAASAQDALERTLLHLAKVAIKETGISDLCMAGGVALNCSSNTKIVRSPHVDNLFIPPNTSDAGVSLGAALLESGKSSSMESLQSAYFGPNYTNEDIKEVLDKVKIPYKHYSNIERKVATLLMDGGIVSWFQGPMEIGPRALGNRSIIANPTLSKTHRDVNKAKDREQWRPLAPSILVESIHDYLDDGMESPFMLHTFSVKTEVRKSVPAIVHTDGTTRPQTVSRKTNPRYHKMISEFGKLSGYNLVMNTSFNGSNEPIVCTPYDAIKSFMSNSTDYLALGNFLIKK